jgi:hypothetical protein
MWKPSGHRGVLYRQMRLKMPARRNYLFGSDDGASPEEVKLQEQEKRTVTPILARPPGVRENGLKWKIDESHGKRGEALTSIFSSLDRLCFF